MLFSATFNGNIVETVCADIEADENLLDTKVMNQLQDKNIEMIIEHLSSSIIFEMAALTEDGTPAKITYHNKITINFELHIWHETSLILRKEQ